MCVCVCVCVCAGQVAVANFNAKGISGSITFTVVPEGIRIQSNLQGLKGEFNTYMYMCVLKQNLYYVLDNTVPSNFKTISLK